MSNQQGDIRPADPVVADDEPDEWCVLEACNRLMNRLVNRNQGTKGYSALVALVCQAEYPTTLQY